MAMFKEAADIKTSDQLHLPVPDAKFETVVVKPSEIQQDMVQALSERAAEVHSGSVDPSVDNMLKITSDGRKISLDQRLMNSALPDDPNSKLNACVNNVLRIWNDTKEQKLTQLIFCDMSDENKMKLQSIAEKYNREISFMEMPNWSEKLNIELKSSKAGWLGFGYNRLFLTEFIPDNVDRVLYLDSDTVIEDSLLLGWHKRLVQEF